MKVAIYVIVAFVDVACSGAKAKAKTRYDDETTTRIEALEKPKHMDMKKLMDMKRKAMIRIIITT